MSYGARIDWRRAIGWIAGCALALQTIVAGFAAMQVAAAAPFDPAAIICHGDGASTSPANETPGAPDHGGGPCWHCTLSGFVTPPLPAPAAVAILTLEPSRSPLIVLRAVRTSSADIASHPGRPRAPPAIA